MSHAFKKISSPVGELKLVASDKGLAAVLCENDDPQRVPLGTMHEENEHLVLLETERQLAEYFGGTRKVFTLPLDMAGTDFQKSVWRALLKIPYGETRSYGELASQLGNVKAMRAVGAANGKNPISIIAPCHRVIGTNGKLTGFAGGIACKEWLLRHEGARLV